MRIAGLVLIFAALAAIFAQTISGQTVAKGCPVRDLKIVSNFETIKRGELVILDILSKDGEKVDGDFTWDVGAGIIASGQGTAHIEVKTPSDAPNPKPLESSAGQVWFSGSHARTVPLKITAIYADGTDCIQKQLSTSVYIGPISIAPNLPANITELLLKNTESLLSCYPAGSLGNVIDVSVKAEDPDNDVLVYEYTVTAGKIVGTGAGVKWDLSGVPPGTYDITAGADDGCGVCGKTMKKSVTVAKCY